MKWVQRNVSSGDVCITAVQRAKYRWAVHLDIGKIEVDQSWSNHEVCDATYSGEQDVVGKSVRNTGKKGFRRSGTS